MKLRLPILLISCLLASYLPSVSAFSGNSTSQEEKNILYLHQPSALEGRGMTLFAEAPTEALKETGNEAGTSYYLSSSLTMTNVAKETIVALDIRGLKKTETLTLSSAGLKVTGELSFDSAFDAVITGGTIAMDSLVAKGAGTLTISSAIDLGTADSTLTVKGGTESSIVFDSVIAGTGSTIQVETGKLEMNKQGHTQNFKVINGAELVFKGIDNSSITSGKFSGDGKVVLNLAIQQMTDAVLGTDWSGFTGHLLVETNLISGSRMSFTSLIGSTEEGANKATVEVGRGAQFWDRLESATEIRRNDWILYAGYQPEGMGTIRASGGATYSGNITVMESGASVGSNGGAINLTGNISGKTLNLGTDNPSHPDKHSLDVVLTGDNNGLDGITILRGLITAQSANALGKTVFLSKGTDLTSRLLIDAAVSVSSFNGVTGTTLTINDTKSLTVTGAEKSTFAGLLVGAGTLNLSGTGLVTLGNSAGYTGVINIGATSSLSMLNTGTTTLKFSGAGALSLGKGSQVVASTMSTGKLSVLDTSSLTINYTAAGTYSLAGVTLGGGSSLLINTTAAATQNLGGLTLAEGSNFLTASGTLTLNAGTLSGSGLLMVRGLDHFSGSLGTDFKVSNVLFQTDDGLYQGKVEGANITKDAKIEELKVNDNVATASYSLTKTLTMNNPAMQTVANLFAQVAADSVLTLTATGLEVTDNFVFDGSGKKLTIEGGQLFLKNLSSTNGSLDIKSNLVINNRITTISCGTGATLTLGNVYVNSGTLILEGNSTVSSLKVDVAGATVTWKDSTTDISGAITFVQSPTPMLGQILTLNAGDNLSFASIIEESAPGHEITLNSGKLTLIQGQVQNFAVTKGAELVFNVVDNAKTANGKMTGAGNITVLNKKGGTLDMGNGLGDGDWSLFGGTLTIDGNGQKMRLDNKKLIGEGLSAGERATIVLTGKAQLYDSGGGGTRTNDWVLFKSDYDDFGTLRVGDTGTYSGNIQIMESGVMISGGTYNATAPQIIFSGDISGETLSFGSTYGDYWVNAVLSGDNKDLAGIDVLRAAITAKHTNALGKNLNLTRNDKVGSTVNIEAAVSLETFKGITGTILNIAQTHSLTVTGTGESKFDGSLKGAGALNLNGTGLVTLSSGNTEYSGLVTIGNGGRLNISTTDAIGTLAKIAMAGGTLLYKGGASSFNLAVEFSNNGKLDLISDQTLSKSVSGRGNVVLNKGVNLTVQGDIFSNSAGLTFKGNNRVDFQTTQGNMGVLDVNSVGNSLNFAGEGMKVLNFSDMLRADGMELVIGNYDYAENNYIKVENFNTAAWSKVAGLTLKNGKGEVVEAMFNSLGHLVAYEGEVVVNSLVSSGTLDGHGYNYAKNESYWGAMDGKVVDFSEEFTFASGAYTYGFTTRDDSSGVLAGDFTVSTKMSDATDGQRLVSILGQEGSSGRTVTFTNEGNSFTGNVTVSQATLKVAATNPGNIVGGNATLLGTGNTVNLQHGATLDLATGAGAYTYANHFSLTGSNSLLKQTNGSHTLGGNIVISGNNDQKVIQNTLASGDMTLAGTLRSVGNNTLILRTEGEDTSRIILNTTGDSELNRLVLEGHVEQWRQTLSVVGGIDMGNNSSYLLKSGALVVGGSLTKSGAGEKIMTFGRGTSLVAAGERLDIDAGIRFDFAEEQSTFTLDTGNAQVYFGATLGEKSNGSTFTKKGQGLLEFGSSMNTKAALTVDQGTLALKEGVQFSTDGFVTFKQGTTLNLGKGSTLNVTSKIFTFNGSLTGSGNLTGVSKLNFQSGTQYAADMSGQSWDVTFQSGSKMSGSLLKHAGNVTFEAGSHIMFDTSLPVSDDSIGISTTGNKTVRFNGATVSATTSSEEIAWDSTQSYVFTLVSSTNELLGKDGNALSSGRLDDSVSVGGDGWGAFLQGQLSVSETGKELLATVTRNGASLSSYAQTANQKSVAGAIDYAMSNFSALGLRGSEIDNIIQYFNKMGKSIGEQAPEMLGMVGGLSNYQALAGQRTDLMRHVEAVRQRANAGKGMAGISSVPDNAFWAEGTQSYSRIDGTDNSSPGYTTQSWGSAIGVDFLAAENYSLGVAFAYSNVKMDSNQYASQVKSDNYYVDLYGRWESGNWNGLAVLSGGTASLDTKRSLVMGEESLQGKGSTDGTQFTIMAEVAYNWQWEEDSPTLQPYFGMTVGSSELDGYTESGLDNAGLIIGKQDLMVAQASLGVRLFKQNIDKEMQYETSRWELRAGLAEEFGDTDFVTNSRFIGLTDYGMSTTSEDIGKTAFQIGGGFSAAIDQAWSVFADVNGEFRAGQTSMNSTLGLRCTF